MSHSALSPPAQLMNVGLQDLGNLHAFSYSVVTLSDYKLEKLIQSRLRERETF